MSDFMSDDQPQTPIDPAICMALGITPEAAVRVLRRLSDVGLCIRSTEKPTTVRQAGDALATAVEGFLEEVRSDDGDPWAERPTQDIFKPSHSIQQALVVWKAAIS